MDGSLGEKNSGDFPTPGRNRRKPAAAPGSAAEPRLGLFPWRLQAAEAKAAPRSRRRPGALPGDPPGAEPSHSPDQYLPLASARAPPAPRPRAQRMLRRRARSPGAHSPRPAQRRWRRARMLMLHVKPKAREPRRLRRRDLARVKRPSSERSVRATSQPDAPPKLPASPQVRAPRAPRPTAAEAAFQELSRNSPHVTAAQATALKRLERYCAGFMGGGL